MTGKATGAAKGSPLRQRMIEQMRIANLAEIASKLRIHLILVSFSSSSSKIKRMTSQAFKRPIIKD